MKKPIYLDNHATTRCDPRVFEAMAPYFCDAYGNASSSSHAFGKAAGDAVDLARQQIASCLGVKSREIFFTSGATESNNLAINGVLKPLRGRGDHVITSAIEHRGVLVPLKRLADVGFDVTFLPPDPHGLISADAVRAALRGRTVLVSVMAANNEIGTINPTAEIGRVCRERQVLFHCDATQAVGKIPLDADQDSIDLLSLSAHKIYGPKGVGALYVRRSSPPICLQPLVEGGGQERGLRSGTLPVPLIVGLGKACEIASREREVEASRLRSLRERLHAGLLRRSSPLRLNGHPSLRLPGNLHVSFPGADGQALVMALRDVAVSSGAACSETDPGTSHVLRALGVEQDLAEASLRFGLGRFTTAEEIDYTVDHVSSVVGRLR